MESHLQASLKGLKIVSFETRRAREMAALVERYGGEAIIAPSMRELPLEENTAALDFMRALQAGKIDVAIFLTGVGTRTLVDAVATTFPRAELVRALKTVKLVARGPKPIAVLKELGLAVDVAIPEPNTWREILAEVKKIGLSGLRVAVQEYGITRAELVDGLRALGADVMLVPVYRWALPEDTTPLKFALKEIAARRAQVALFTNATQIDHLFRIAAEQRLEDQLRVGLSHTVIASVGPVCTEALAHYGLKADIEPTHSKMGHLIAAVASEAPALLDAKRKTK
jgi:uroporphyrinogen-III synthase